MMFPIHVFVQTRKVAVVHFCYKMAKDTVYDLEHEINVLEDINGYWISIEVMALQLYGE